MKKILIMLTFLISFISADEKVMKDIHTNVLLKDVNIAINKAEILKEHLNKKTSLALLQRDFKALVVSWKKVETFYIASEINEEVVDTPRYIDVFHNLKENLTAQMQRVIDSKDDVAVEMYKNSFKTVNALEYVLFVGDFSLRKKEISLLIIDNIISKLQDIKEVYTYDSKKFILNYKWSNETIINMLIDSSFKLKDWRIGDMAGLSRKYDGKADNRRAEYFLSKTSKDAIASILEVHKEVMDSKTHDFGDMLIENGYEKEVISIRTLIDDSIKNLETLKNENFEDKEVKKLYESVSKLHRAYYASLVNALGVTSKILDADGD